MPLKAYDTQGSVLHCGSFSKQLAPGFRVGWIAAGCYAMQIEKRQSVSSLAVGAPNQLAIADYLKQGGYDSHLRRLRETLSSRHEVIRTRLKALLPPSTVMSQPTGGYFLWIMLDKGIDTRDLFQALRPYGVTIAPGALFASDGRFNHCFRLNVSIVGRQNAEGVNDSQSLEGLTQIASSISALSVHSTVTAEY